MAETIALTPEIRAKRVAVARDVVEQIDAGQIRVMTGNYIRACNAYGFSSHLPRELYLLADAKEDLQPHLARIRPHCKVCAIGAGVLAKAKLFDAVPMQPNMNYYRSDACDALSDIFDDRTLAMIEAAFELLDDVIPPAIANECSRDIRDSIQFGNSIDGNAPARCRAIWQNVADNDGLFLPVIPVAAPEVAR